MANCRRLSSLPLLKYRVVDLTRVLAGPFGTMNLGDLGADVIKVERPGVGDETRQWGPPFITPSLSNYFTSCNRNKRSIAVDYTTHQGQQIIQQLAAHADVFVENLRPASLAKYNLDYASLKSANPRLIYASLTGYGQTGPYAHKSAYDLTIAAEGGLMGITGPEQGVPVKVGVAITDICSGMYLYSAILAALLAREKSGTGQYIDVSMLSAQLSVLVNIASNYLNSDIIGKPRGSSHPSIVPYQGFSTADGYVVVAANNNKQYTELAEVLGLPAHHPDYATNRLRVQHRAQLVSLLSQCFLTQTTQHWVEKAANYSFSISPINDVAGAFAHPQTHHSDIVKTVHSECEGVDVKVVGHPVRYSAHPDLEYRAPPVLGQHTVQVLGELGYSHQDISLLDKQEVVQCHKPA